MDNDDLDKDSKNYLGKLRSNFLGTEFTIYDKGISPAEVKHVEENASLHIVRQELAYIQYESNFLGSRGPRKMYITIPKIDETTGNYIEQRPLKTEDSLAERTKSSSNRLDNFLSLMNKPPAWNAAVGAYVLNFNGRVTEASVKNFQLVDKEDIDHVILQFGKCGKDKFTMDIKYPMSPLQAFGICLSSFDYKIACE